MNRIKQILQFQGRTQAWLAGEIGKSYVIVTNYCNNKRQPSIPVLNKIAESLNTDVRDLLVPTRPKQHAEAMHPDFSAQPELLS